MDIGDWLFSANCALGEQIAKQIFDILSKEGPIMIIMDRDDHCWVSNCEEFSKLNISESFLKDLCVKVGDDIKPVITQANECSIIAAQLNTEQTRCGYVIIALPQYSPESTLININLIETLLNQTGLIAKLIEKNNLLYELQRKRLSSYTQSETTSN